MKRREFVGGECNNCGVCIDACPQQTLHYDLHDYTDD